MRMVHDITLQQIHFGLGLIQLSAFHVTLFLCVCSCACECVRESMMTVHKDLFQLFLISPVKGMAGKSGTRSSNQHTPRECVCDGGNDKTNIEEPKSTERCHFTVLLQ